MFPTLVKIGSFEITTFGLMMFLAFVVGGWVLARQFRRYGSGKVKVRPLAFGPASEPSSSIFSAALSPTARVL